MTVAVAKVPFSMSTMCVCRMENESRGAPPWKTPTQAMKKFSDESNAAEGPPNELLSFGISTAIGVGPRLPVCAKPIPFVAESTLHPIFDLG